MKQAIKLSVIFFMMACFAFIQQKHNPVGHWKIFYRNGSDEYVDFYKNGTYKSVSGEGTLTHQGNYKMNDNIISVNDNEGCGDNYWGSYKLTFYTEDSVLNTVVEDSCIGRKEAVDGSVLVRQKEN